jgi:FkbM family methyltransferase
LLLFDIGANRGDAVVAGLEQGYEIIAIEPSRVFAQLVKSHIYNSKVTPLRYAVSYLDYAQVEFYEADEDGLSTLNKDWLTSDLMPYNGKVFTTTTATTITIDTLARIYGKPDLMKIDVEGAEWSVFRGMSKKYGTLTFEWTEVTMGQHIEQLQYLAGLGYTQVAPQFIEHHLQQPAIWYSIKSFNFPVWHIDAGKLWEEGGWMKSYLRPTADVGMMWVR